MSKAMPRPKRHRFLHEYVTHEIRERISEDVYPPGSPLPSRAALAKEFGVSDITVRRAMKELATEGLVTSHQGVGNIVNDRTKVVRMLTSVFEPDEMQQPDHVQSIQPIALDLLSSETPSVPDLGSEANDLIYRFERMILLDGNPFSHEVAFFPRRLGDRFKEDLRSAFLSNLILREGAKPTRRDIKIEGGVTTAHTSMLLNVPPGSPILVSSYTWYQDDGQVVLTGRSSSRADRMVYLFSMDMNLDQRPDLPQPSKRSHRIK